jgi:DHA2 family multidrug resistance protein-like MFS transporter
MSGFTNPTTSPQRATRKTWIALAVLILPILLIAVDGTVLVFALPDISRDLSPSAAEQLWIVDVYSFMLAGLLVTMGSLGDRIGRKRLLLTGAVLFTLASTLGAFATSPIQLILARAALGLAGSTIMPSTLSLIRGMFLDRAQRRTATAVWTAAAMLGAAAGPVVGGLLLEHFWWGSVFLMNVPIMVLLLILGPRLLPESRNPDAKRLDLPSTVLSLAGILPIVYAIKKLAEGGAVGTPLLALAVGLFAGSLFVRRQTRLEQPMLDIRLFKIRAFRGAVIGDLLSIFALVGALIAVTQYLQLVVGLSPLEAGLWLMPSTLVSAVATFVAVALVKRFGTPAMVTIGLLVAAVGFIGLVTIHADSGALPVVLMVSVISLGAGIGMTLTNDVIMSSVPPERAGSAAAISETAYELGGALGTAIIGSVIAASYGAGLRGSATAEAAVPSGALHRAGETISEAFAVAGTLPAGPARALTDAASVAYSGALGLVGIITGVIMLATAALALRTLRGVSAHGDLSPTPAARPTPRRRSSPDPA